MIKHTKRIYHSYDIGVQILFGIVVLILTRQVPLIRYAIIGNIALIGIFILNIKNIIEKNFLSFINAAILIWIAIISIYSVIHGNEPALIFRFALIIILTLFAYFIKLPNVVNILYFFVFMQCIALIILELILIIFFSVDTYLPIRHYSLFEKEWGDIWTTNGYFYRIQVKGNALIPLAYMLSFTKYVNFKYKKLSKTILLLGTIFAGNFVFLISLAIFHTVIFFDVRSEKRLQKKTIFFIIISIVIFFPVYSYIKNTLESKDVSLSTRTDQVSVLLSDLEKTSLLFGSGFGHTVSVATKYRDYSNSIYYEVQSIYLLNQMGIFNFIVFIFLHILFAINFISQRKLLLIYFLYIVYAVTNPYIFDTNHVIAIIVLTTLNRLKNENRMHISTLQSQYTVVK